MNEEMEQFEQRLRQQRVKKIPGKWRAEILAIAREAQPIRHSSFDIRSPRQSRAEAGHSRLSTINQKLSTLLWPHPKAWAGLAAVWVCIFALNFSMRDKPVVLAAKASFSSPEVMAELKQQQKMLAELIGPVELRVADRQRLLPSKPHSERIRILAA
jgi:hypothetical protein